jgi:hypothetical protein
MENHGGILRVGLDGHDEWGLPSGYPASLSLMAFPAHIGVAYFDPAR